MNLQTMRTKLRYYLDDVNSQRWSNNTELNYYINIAYRSYYDELVVNGYKGLLTTPVELDTVANVESVALPVDFLKAWRVDRILPGGYAPLDFREIYEDYIYKTGASYSYYRPTYSFRGNNLILNPIPQNSETSALRVIYYPNLTVLSDDTDEPVIGFRPSWQEMIPVKAAIIAKQGREEDDATGLISILDSVSKGYNEDLSNMTDARIRNDGFNFGDYDDDYFIY